MFYFVNFTVSSMVTPTPTARPPDYGQPLYSRGPMRSKFPPPLAPGYSNVNPPPQMSHPQSQVGFNHMAMPGQPYPQAPLPMLSDMPRGTYPMAEVGGGSGVGGTPSNPFRGKSIPNEPSGLVEARLPPSSPPVKMDPTPSSAFSGAMYRDNRMPSMPLDGTSLPQPPPPGLPQRQVRKSGMRLGSFLHQPS